MGYYNNQLLPKVYDDLKDNLILLYDFSDGGSSSTVTDKSGNSRTGTVVHGSTGDNDSYADMWTNGSTGGINFDGVNDHINCNAFGSDFQSLTNMTIEFWGMNASASISDWQIWFDLSYSTTHALTAYTDPTGLDYLYVKLESGGSNQSVFNAQVIGTEYDKMFHFILTANDADGCKLYINAKEYTFGTNNTGYFESCVSSCDTFAIGDRLGTETKYPLDGTLNKFAIYNTILSDKQIQQIFNYERQFIPDTNRPARFNPIGRGVSF